MKYNPDFCLWYKPHKLSKQTIIFEIIDTQDESKTIADVIRMKLLGNCRKGFFICKDEKKYAMAEKVLDVLLSNFKDILKTRRKKDVLDIDPILIPENAKIDDIVRVFSEEIENALPH